MPGAADSGDGTARHQTLPRFRRRSRLRQPVDDERGRAGDEHEHGQPREPRRQHRRRQRGLRKAQVPARPSPDAAEQLENEIERKDDQTDRHRQRAGWR